jgi:serine/threonine-protein kinase
LEEATLRDRLDVEKQLPVDEAIRIATAVANALDFAHRQGVVHRDIKPANILFQGGQPVVGDFGIALAIGAGGGARLTETGLSVGTPHYTAPEQATGDQQVGPRSDIYSLGCVLYEMLVGDPPSLLRYVAPPDAEQEQFGAFQVVLGFGAELKRRIPN